MHVPPGLSSPHLPPQSFLTSAARLHFRYLYTFKSFTTGFPDSPDAAALFAVPTVCEEEIEELRRKHAEAGSEAAVAGAAAGIDANAGATMVGKEEQEQQQPKGLGEEGEEQGTTVPEDAPCWAQRQRQELGGRRQHPFAWQVHSALPNAWSLDREFSRGRGMTVPAAWCNCSVPTP